MKLLISPYSSKLKTGTTNPKNFPYFESLVRLLNQEGYRIIQIGVTGEEKIEGVSHLVLNASYAQLKEIANECATWIAVDNFWPHFCHANKLKPGIVLWGASDPRVWGYPENINLLRGRDFLRQHQYQTWSEIDYDPRRFVYAENIVPHVHSLAPLPLAGRLMFA